MTFNHMASRIQSLMLNNVKKGSKSSRAIVGPSLNQNTITKHLEYSSKILNHISSSLLPRPPIEELQKMADHLNYLLVGYERSLSMSNCKKLKEQLSHVKELIGDFYYKDYLGKIKEVNLLK